MRLLTVANAKTIKGEPKRWLTGILYLKPNRKLCPDSSAGCRKGCLNTAGRGRFSTVQECRVRKSTWLRKSKAGFIRQLHKDIEKLKAKAARKNMNVAIRLNGTSDVPWESKDFGCIPQAYPEIQFYDYTASIKRLLSKDLPSNYYLTFSHKERRKAWKKALAAGFNVSMVFDEVPVGKTIQGYKVVSGDDDDLRFLDPKLCIVGVKAKGDAKQDTTGFVIRVKKG